MAKHLLAFEAEKKGATNTSVHKTNLQSAPQACHATQSNGCLTIPEGQKSCTNMDIPTCNQSHDIACWAAFKGARWRKHKRWPTNKVSLAALSCSQIACPNLLGSPRENYNLHMSHFSTAITRNVNQKHSSKERLMPTYFGPKWGSITKTGPEEAHKSETFHEALATSTTSLYHGGVGTCSQQIQIERWFVCINLGRSKRVLHQLWKPESAEGETDVSHRPETVICQTAPLQEQHCHRGVVLFETWADAPKSPKKTLISACNCDSHEMPCHQTIALPDGVLLAPDFMAQLLGQTTHNAFTHAQMAAALSFLQAWKVSALTIFINFGRSDLTSTLFWARKLQANLSKG